MTGQIKPIDAFYKRVFNMTYAEKKQQEEMEYFVYENGEKKKLENLQKKHNQYIKSLGIEIDVDSGEILQQRHGVILIPTTVVDHHFLQVTEFLVQLIKNYTRTLYQKVRQLVFRIINPYMIVDKS